MQGDITAPLFVNPGEAALGLPMGKKKADRAAPRAARHGPDFTGK